MGLMRMTNSEGLGLAKVVRRKLEVLYLSGNGATALLGVFIKQEDTRALDIGEDGREFLREPVHVFKFSMQPNQNPAPVEDTPPVRGAVDEEHGRKSSMTFSNIDKIMSTIVEYTPIIYFVLGRDSDGVLRSMGVIQIFPTDGGSSDGSSPYHVPMFNSRFGDFKFDDNVVIGSNGIPHRNVGWMGWMIPGDDRNSQNFPWQFKTAVEKTGPERASAASNCYNLLTCYFNRLVCLLPPPPASTATGWCANTVHHGCILLECLTGVCFPALSSQPGGTIPGVCVGYFNPCQDHVTFATRRCGGVDELRPRLTRYASYTLSGLCCAGEGADHEAQEVRKAYKLFEGSRQFWEYGELLAPRPAAQE